MSARLDLQNLLVPLANIAAKASTTLMRHYTQGTPDARRKADGSPVTIADEESEAIIEAGLHALTSGIPVVGEEAAASGRNYAESHRFWLVDPLDGTHDFLAGTGEFSICIGLIENGHPALGLVAEPMTNRIMIGAGQGSLWEMTDTQPLRKITPDPAIRQPLLGLQSHTPSHKGDPESVVGKREIEWRTLGSALKFMRIAEGKADLYARRASTSEWDTAAGHALLNAAGGALLTMDRQPLTYGKPGFSNPEFIAVGPHLAHSLNLYTFAQEGN